MLARAALLLLLCLATCSAGRKRRQSCNCKPLVYCAGRFPSLRALEKSECLLDSNNVGVCCSDITKGGPRPNPFSLRTDDKVLARPSGVNEKDLQAKLAENNRPDETKKSFADRSELMHRMNQRASADVKALYMDPAYQLHSLVDVIPSSHNDIEEGVNAVNDENIAAICPYKPITCTESRYRTINGSCNNRENPLLGMRVTPFQRLIPADYGPRTSMRMSSQKQPLPNARMVTTNIFLNGDQPNGQDVSEQFIQFGQFLDHDMTHTPMHQIDCCHDMTISESDGTKRQKMWKWPETEIQRECIPIQIFKNDTFWGPKGRECMTLARDELSCNLDCKGGQREHANQLTHWLDLSNIYGGSGVELEDVRDMADRRLLLVSEDSAGETLPPRCSENKRFHSKEEPHVESCEFPCNNTEVQCFISGDFRVNEQPGLTIEHLVWIREHNRLAVELSGINPRWDHEKVFQEARMINIAIYQHIIYNEWLPIALGPTYMKVQNMVPLSVGSGFTVDYDHSLDPRITNEFSAAAFRFGHSMVKGTLAQRNSAGKEEKPIDLTKCFFKPKLLQDKDFVVNTIRGATRSKAAERDRGFAEDLINNLFSDGKGGGLDLMSINVQRGRDRGIPGYNKYRELCASGNFGKITSFDQLTRGKHISQLTARRMGETYQSVDDIDLFVGGTAENAHGDAILGPTFKCIIGDQFLRLKKGDRYWYERSGLLTRDQLNEVRKSSLSRVICNNFKKKTQEITQMQPLAFRALAKSNQLNDCSNTIALPIMDLSMWLDEKAQ